MIRYKLEAALPAGSTGEDLANVLAVAAEQIRTSVGLTAALQPSSLSTDAFNAHGRVRIVHGVQSVETPPANG